MLDLGGGYQMYYEEYGIPTGKPVVILHGGPGGGIQRKIKNNFNLKKWRVIMFDQRGCGKSLPRGIDSLAHNTTWDLVSDIEKLRDHLGIDKWTVYGGSWGTTLALAYAETHPTAVSGIVMRGIFLGQKWETDWLYNGGVGAVWPELWEKFKTGSYGGRSKTQKAGKADGSLIKRYRRLLTSKNRHTRHNAAKAWWGFESDISYLLQKPYTTKAKEAEELAVLENHYFSHNCWLGPTQLLDNAHKLKNIPVRIVQGRYDMVCPMRAAWQLCQELPHAKMTVIPNGGHGFEPDALKVLKKVISELV